MILVTGATGKIGREVLRQLSGVRAPARALVRDGEKAAFLALPGIELAAGDFLKPRTLMLVLFRSYREGYGAAVSGAVSEVTRREPRTFRQFAKDYARVFREGKRETEL